MTEDRLIEGRLVKLTKRKNQKIRIRARRDAGKMWEYIFEISPEEQHVSKSDLRQHTTVSELVEWLLARGANQVEDLTDVELLSVAPHREWLSEAVRHVDDATNELIDVFRATPYLHRVEHSLHLHFYELLVGTKYFAGLYPIGNTGEETQLIHKEWPETRPRPDKGGRGNFDFAILAPEQLAQARPDQFAGGHIEAAIVVEIGLNYDYDHLAGDHKKLVDSAATSGNAT